MWPENNSYGAFGGWTPQGNNFSGVPTGPSMQANPLGLSMVNMAPIDLSGYGQNPQLTAPPSLNAASGGGGGLANWLSKGQNLGTAIQGFGSLASAYLGFQQMKQAKEGLKFQKEAFNANLGNSIKTYNTSLEDRINGRTSNYDGKDKDVQSYLSKHSLSRNG